MKPVTIYQSGNKTSGSIKITSKKERLIKPFIKGISSGMIAISMMGFWAIYGPVITEELAYQTGNRGFEEINYAQIAEANEIEAIQKEAQSYGVESHFSVVIPKIGASQNIIANVDPAKPEFYEKALMQGVAHAKGTYFPGQNENVFLFAHSTNSPLNVAKYNATFYLLNKLDKDDEIVVFFADKKYIYKVSETHIIDPDDTSWLEKTNKEQLTLQTCYPPGTTWKRLIVVADPVQTEAI